MARCQMDLCEFHRSYACFCFRSANVPSYTNLDDAREEGERRRAEKERAEGPIVKLPSGVK
jgi:hypothetical protein